MSKLSRVLAKSTTIEIPLDDGSVESVVLQPLTNRELLDVSEVMDKGKMRDSVNLLLLITFKKSMPDVTVDEIEKIPAGIMIDAANKIAEISGLGSLFGQKKNLSGLETRTGQAKSLIESLDKKLAAGEL